MKKWEKIEDAINLYLIGHWKWFISKTRGALTNVKTWIFSKIDKIGNLKVLLM